MAAQHWKKFRKVLQTQVSRLKFLENARGDPRWTEGSCQLLLVNGLNYIVDVYGTKTVNSAIAANTVVRSFVRSGVSAVCGEDCMRGWVSRGPRACLAFSSGGDGSCFGRRGRRLGE